MQKYLSNDQSKMYIEKSGKGLPIVLIPGAFHSGICYTVKPNGLPGWVNTLKKSYTTYVTDLPGHGRSAKIPLEQLNGRFIVEVYKNFLLQIEGPVILLAHSIAGPYVFKLIEELPVGKISHFVGIEPGPFGNIAEPAVPEKETESEAVITYKGITFTIDMTKFNFPQQNYFDRIMNKSTTRFIKTEEEKNRYIGTLIGVAPKLLYERFNVHESQLRIDDFQQLTHCKYLIVTSPLDPLHKDEDKKIVEKLKVNNIDATHIPLEDKGILGNSHMMMLEDNSDDIIRMIMSWLQK